MSDTNSLIVLVHGFSANRVVMWPFASLLRARGFRVRQWCYRSFFEPIATHAARLSDFLKSIPKTEGHLHIVAHSMGAIVTRSALRQSESLGLGRLVFLAPPNGGSPVARHAAKILGRILPPTLELSDTRTSFVNQLACQTDLDIGIIAARFDLLVPTRNTHLSTQKAHVVINATHNSLLVSNAASRLTANYLNSGSFST